MQDGDHKAEPRSSYVEGARDVAVLEAMLESSGKQGAMVQVKKFWQISISKRRNMNILLLTRKFVASATKGTSFHDYAIDGIG